MLILLTIVITFILTTVLMYNLLKGRIDTSNFITSSKSDSQLIQTLHRFRELIDTEYIGGEIDEQALVDGAVKGYVEALGDPFSQYYTAEEMDDIMAETMGNYIGVGMYLGSDLVNNIIYLWPMEGSPAEKAGVQNEDILLKVNGIAYSAEETDQAVDVMKQGNAGETVTLEVKRGEETLEIVVTKEKIILKHTSARMIDEEIGLIQIENFDGGAAEEFKTKYQELEAKGMKKLIVDIRNNGGGIVEEALTISDLFLEKDQIMLIQKDKSNPEKVSKSENDPMIKMPVVVLTNEQSASAAEIFAAALKENDRAKLVGTTTYGKGIIQTMRQFSDGSGIKLTTDEFLTPKRNKIHGVGISPDVEVKLDPVIAAKPVIEESEDLQLQKAIEEIKK